MTEADPALAIANDDERRKAEALAALDRLRDAVDVNQFLDQLFAAIVAAWTAATIVATPTVAITAATILATATGAATATAATRTTALRRVLRRALGTGNDFRRVDFVGHS